MNMCYIVGSSSVSLWRCGMIVVCVQSVAVSKCSIFCNL